MSTPCVQLGALFGSRVGEHAIHPTPLPCPYLIRGDVEKSTLVIQPGRVQNLRPSLPPLVFWVDQPTGSMADPPSEMGGSLGDCSKEDCDPPVLAKAVHMLGACKISANNSKTPSLANVSPPNEKGAGGRPRWRSEYVGERRSDGSPAPVGRSPAEEAPAGPGKCSWRWAHGSRRR